MTLWSEARLTCCGDLMTLNLFFLIKAESAQVMLAPVSANVFAGIESTVDMVNTLGLNEDNEYKVGFMKGCWKLAEDGDSAKIAAFMFDDRGPDERHTC